MTLSSRKILVTGASGFLGSHLTRRLLERGAEVHAVSRKQRNTSSNSPRWWQADTSDAAVAGNLITTVRPDLIYHFAGLSTAVPDLEVVLPILHSLLVSTVNILTAATEIGGCRVILAASLTEPQPGHAHPTPGSPYAAAKWASSGYARMFHELYQLPVVIVRPFMTYGPAQDHRKIIPSVILSLLRGEIPKLSSGYQQFDWIYIDDVIHGLLAAGEAPGVEGCTIDLGSGTLTSVRTIAQKLAELMGARTELLFGALTDRPFEQTRVAEIADAYAKLGWRPMTSLDSGLERTVTWYREHA
jgi:nucleoside-diphosphate-sugar epimerase